MVLFRRHTVLETGARDLVIFSDNAGSGLTGIAALLKAGRIRKVICSYPRTSNCFVVEELFKEGKVEIDSYRKGRCAEYILFLPSHRQGTRRTRQSGSRTSTAAVKVWSRSRRLSPLGAIALSM